MGLFRKLGILMIVTWSKWSLMTVTASGHHPGIHIRSASIRGYLDGYWQASTQGSNHSKPSTKVCSNLKTVAEI